jgi:protein TonB
MKKIFLFLLLLNLSPVFLKAQTEGETTPNKNEDVFTVVETMPEYPGGEKAMNKFLDENLTYPKDAIKQGIQGKVWVGFIVDKEGKIAEIEVLRGIGGGCDEEAVRVIAKMPNWIPGKQSGKPVVVKFRFPINFTLR